MPTDKKFEGSIKFWELIDEQLKHNGQFDFWEEALILARSEDSSFEVIEKHFDDLKMSYIDMNSVSDEITRHFNQNVSSVYDTWA